MATETVILTVELSNVREYGGFKIANGTLDPIQPEGAPEVPSWVMKMSREGKLKLVGSAFGTATTGDLVDLEAYAKRHPKYGPQLEVVYVQTCVRRDDRAFYAFLRRLPFIGPIRARSILNMFDGDADAILAALEHNVEALTSVPGITAERASDIAATFAQLEGERDAWLLCRELDLQPRVGARIIDKLGGSARAIIHADPFMLMHLANMSFRDCDTVRDKLGIPKDDPRRLAAGAFIVLRTALMDGDCKVHRRKITGAQTTRKVDQARREIGLTPSEIDGGLQVLLQPTEVRVSKRDDSTYIMPPRAAVEGDHWYLASVHRAERTIATRMRAMLQSAP